MNSSIQDFALVNTYVLKLKEELSYNDSSNAFYFLVLGLILNLQEDEIRDSITDNHYLGSIGQVAGHDRGIDAIYIEEQKDGNSVIHFFNCKYTLSFEKTKSFIPSNEIDKVLGFLNQLFSKDSILKNEVNPILFAKAQEIWDIFENHNPSFVFHICSNYYNDFEPAERDRFRRGIDQHSNFEIIYYNISDFVALLTQRGKQVVNAKINAIGKNLFEKSDGDIRALTVNFDARDLLRIVLDSEDLRNNAAIEDFSVMKRHRLLEDAFDGNIRVYLKQRTKINKNIKNTILSAEAHRFFYYNNGITITCSNFTYSKSIHSPVIELKNIQIVNGGQTMHALYEAFLEDSSYFENIDVLCRIYQTTNLDLTVKIAEYTNSQNPVNNRDIRSLDFSQIKVEQELLALGYFYERKKNQYSVEPRSKRIDAEKVGQVLLSFYNGMPSEAKNEKRIIFADKYEEIFNENITADKILLPYKLFEKIEFDKSQDKEKFITGIDDNEKSSYTSYASYYILFFLGVFMEFKNIQPILSNLDEIWQFKGRVLKLIEDIIKKEKLIVAENGGQYSHITFFKYNRPKRLYEEMKHKELESYINEFS